MNIIEDDLTGPEIQDLLALHAKGMQENSPKGACHYLDVSALAVPEITVWSMWDGGLLAGCGALRELDRVHGEVKSMRTSKTFLGKGVGRKMLEHIIAVAKDRGYERLSLETGTTRLFAAAICLYEGSGFKRCGPFADYPENDFSRFYTMDLT